MNDCVLNKANGTPPVLDLILPTQAQRYKPQIYNVEFCNSGN